MNLKALTFIELKFKVKDVLVFFKCAGVKFICPCIAFKLSSLNASIPHDF